MREFFRGWQRKMGAVTLLMACVLLGVWLRSEIRYDSIALFIKPYRYGISSSIGRLRLQQTRRSDSIRFFVTSLNTPTDRIYDTAIEKNERWLHEPWTEFRPNWQMSFLGFHLSNGKGTGRGEASKELETLICFVPYWSLVIPLTLLSACLLLSKRRPKLNQPVSPA